MSKINVVLPDGRVVSVDEDTAQTAEGSNVHQESTDESSARHDEATRQDLYGGTGNAIAEAGLSALDTASFGAAGKVASELGGGSWDRFRKGIHEEHPDAAFAGDLVGMVAPTGLLGDAVKAGTEFSAMGLAAKAGESAGGGAIGRAVEGGLVGAGGYVASTNASGDPLTIEAAVESAGFGALFNVGVGRLADSLTGVAHDAKLGVWKNDIARGAESLDIEAASKGNAAFNDTPPSYNEFREAHAAQQSAIKQYNGEVTKEAAAYEGFYGNNAKLTGAIKSADDMLSDVRNSRYAAAGIPKDNLEFVDGQWRAKMTVATTDATSGAAGESTMLKPVQPPISEDLSGRIKDYKERVSAIIKKKAGGVRVDGGKWVKDASVLPDPRGALEDLRALQGELKSGTSGFPLASGKLKELPPVPRDPKPFTDVTVPKTLQEFARTHPETIGKLANSLEPASPAADAFGRLTDDLGLTRSATPGATIADVHASLKDYNAKLSEFRQKAATKAAEDDAKHPLLKLANKAAKYSASRAADHIAGGGMIGAVARVAGGEVMGKALNKAEDVALGSVLVSSKATLRSRVQNLVAKYGVPTASLARKLGPVTAYLSQSFPSGKKDPEPDQNKQAVNRINEIMGHSMSSPDTAFMAVQNMLGHPSDAAFKIHQHLVSTLQYLASTLPRDPGTDTHMFGSNWTPQHQDAIALAHRLEAVQDPLTAIARAISGDGHPASTEALWSAYPNIMNELSQEIAYAAPQMKKLTYQQASAYSQLFRTPMSGLQEPVVVTTIQGLYLPKQQSAPGGAQGGGSAGPSKPPGRPAAVQSSVAGSSPSLLTSQ